MWLALILGISKLINLDVLVVLKVDAGNLVVLDCVVTEEDE